VYITVTVQCTRASWMRAGFTTELVVGVGCVLADERSFFVELAEVDVTGVLVETAAVVTVCLVACGTLQRSATASQLRPTPGDDASQISHQIPCARSNL